MGRAQSLLLTTLLSLPALLAPLIFRRIMNRLLTHRATLIVVSIALSITTIKENHCLPWRYAPVHTYLSPSRPPFLYLTSVVNRKATTLTGCKCRPFPLVFHWKHMRNFSYFSSLMDW